MTVVLTLALGIGLATAVFTVAEALLLRPLPVVDQDRVVVVWGATSDGRFDNFPLLLEDAREFASQSRSLERVEFFAWWGARPVPISEDGRVFRLRRSLVSGGYFDLLGTPPALGRGLRPEDDVTGAPLVAVLSHGAWQRYFGGDPGVVGRTLVMHGSGAAHTIVGVMPVGLDYPRGTDFWAPVLPSSGPLGDHPVYTELNVLGRLHPSATVADARAEMSRYFGRPGAPAWHRDLHGVAHSLTSAVLGDVRPALLAFAAAAGVLLLITCINVANLLLVRGLGRVREITVRSALGASRGRIVGQLVGESAFLAAAGGILGLSLAATAVRVFISFAPAGTPRLEEIQLNGATVVAAILITAVATLLFALGPALVTSGVNLEGVLRSGTQRSGTSRRFRLATEALVVGQVALALLVLSGAGLITRSLVELERADLSFDPARLLIAELSVPDLAFGDSVQSRALLDRLIPRLESVPGVLAVSPVLSAPFTGSGAIFGQPAAEGQSEDEAATNPTMVMEVVTPDYFATFDIPLVRGRVFSEQDREGSTPVVMISASAARHYWPDVDPIGKRIHVGPRFATVVGVVPEIRYHDLRDPRPTLYFPLEQSTFPVEPMTLAIRTGVNAADVGPSLRRATTEVAPGVALASAAPFETLLEVPLAQARLNALLLIIVAAAALLLAAVGLFGVMMTMVRQRTRELGIRMALGATSRDVRRMVLARGLTLALSGAAVGMLGALMANRVLAAMLYEVSPTDALTLGIVASLLLVVASIATLVPARAGTRVDPVIALRAET